MTHLDGTSVSNTHVKVLVAFAAQDDSVAHVVIQVYRERRRTNRVPFHQDFGSLRVRVEGTGTVLPPKRVAHPVRSRTASRVDR